MDPINFSRIIDLLTPHMEKPGDRRTLITPAFSGYPVIYSKIDWTGSAREFTVRIVQQLDRYGELERGHPALAYLLQALKPQVGIQDRDEIDLLERELKGTTPPDSSAKQPVMQNKPQRPLQVFLCHASGDKADVRNLYQRLRLDGVEPWLDSENLLPGQDWKWEIPQAVRQSDVVLVLLSHNALNAQGYIREELRLALNTADILPVGTIYIIPLKLEECAVPQQLVQWHWVNLFDENGYERLLKSLEIRARDLNARIPIWVSGVYEYVQVPTDEGHTEPTIPYFPNAKNDSLDQDNLETKTESRKDVPDIFVEDKLILENPTFLLNEQNKVKIGEIPLPDQPQIKIHSTENLWVKMQILASPPMTRDTILVSVGFLLLILSLVGWITWSFWLDPLRPRPTSENPGDIFISGIVSITPANPKVGELVTAEVQIANKKPYPYKIKIAMSGRGPNACSKEWFASPQSWLEINTILYPGEPYTYIQSRTFDSPGNYFAETSMTSPEGEWSSIQPYPRTWFNVSDESGQLHHPDCLVVVNGLEDGLMLSSQKIRTGESITLTYTIRNDQPEAFRHLQLTAEIRVPDARQAAFLAQFPTQEDVVLLPDQRYTYHATHRFHTPGEYLIEPFYHNEHYWRPIWPYSAVLVNVEE